MKTMHKKLTQGLLTTFIFTAICSFAIFASVNKAEAQTPTLCQSIESFITSGVIAPDKASAARLAGGCSVATSTPSVTITANGVSNYLSISSAQNVTIAWNASNATSCQSSSAVSKPLSGSQTVYVSESGIFTILCSGTLGTATSSVTVELGATTVTSPSASLIGTSTLALSYDSNQKESKLSASFMVAVTAGSDQDLNVYQYDATISFTNQTNTNYVAYGGATLVPALDWTSVKTGTDQFGQKYYTVPAGTTVNFVATSELGPQSMFAGSYTASFYGVFGYYGNDAYGSFSLPVSQNQTNAVTIVGETSPYITLVPNPVNSGTQVTVSGVRFYDSTSMSGTSQLLFDGIPQTSGYTVTQTTIDFTLPQLSAGSHSIQYVNNNGASNVAWFTVQDQSSVLVTLTPNPVVVGGKLHVTIDDSKSGFSDKTAYAIISLYSLSGKSYLPADFIYQKDPQGRWYADYVVPVTAEIGTWVVEQVGVFDKTNVLKYFNYPADIDTTFTVTKNVSTNKAPVINGITAPTTLKVGEMGTWTVKASDPENGSLSYGVVWGDEVNTVTSNTRTPSAPAVKQTATFTHAYATAGTYKPTFTVTDDAGKSVTSSATVKVTGTTVVVDPPLTTFYLSTKTIANNSSFAFAFDKMDVKSLKIIWSDNGGNCAAQVKGGTYTSDWKDVSSPGTFTASNLGVTSSIVVAVKSNGGTCNGVVVSSISGAGIPQPVTSTTATISISAPSSSNALTVGQPFRIAWIDSSSNNMGDTYNISVEYINTSGIKTQEKIVSNISVSQLYGDGSMCGSYACRYTWTPQSAGTNAHILIEGFHVNNQGYSSGGSELFNIYSPSVTIPNAGTCSDGIQNGDETYVDQGGRCVVVTPITTPCPTGQIADPSGTCIPLVITPVTPDPFVPATVSYTLPGTTIKSGSTYAFTLPQTIDVKSINITWSDNKSSCQATVKTSTYASSLTDIGSPSPFTGSDLGVTNTVKVLVNTKSGTGYTCSGVVVSSFEVSGLTQPVAVVPSTQVASPVATHWWDAILGWFR